MLSGVSVMVFAFGFLIFLWVMVLWGSRYFGSPPEH